MRIAHITDLHIGADCSLVEGVDVRQNFRDILASVKNHNVDHIVIGGDICFREALPHIYTWVQGQLEKAGVSYSVIPGNHDDIAMMSEIFSYQSFTFGFILHSIPLFFLDTSDGLVSDKQKNELVSFAQANQAPLVFMHHPPTLCEVPHMDSKHSLKNHEDFFEVIIQTGVSHVFCGHYHIEKTCSKAGTNVYITPSTFFQLGDNSEEFSLLTSRAGWRIIDIIDSAVFTRVEWL